MRRRFVSADGGREIGSLKPPLIQATGIGDAPLGAVKLDWPERRSLGGKRWAGSWTR
jgi:hypothetical protein